MDHGLEVLSRVKARAFFALAVGQKRAKEGEIPVFVYNPHPFTVKAMVECEFQLPDINWKDSFILTGLRSILTSIAASESSGHRNKPIKIIEVL